MNKELLKKEVQDFIRESKDVDLNELILQGKAFNTVSSSELATQISGLRKAEKKLPQWYAARDIIYPPNLNLEQTSSQITAQYKASLVAGKEMADLTGGFGIDSFYFAEKVNHLTYCEIDPELSEMAAHNFKIMGKDNISCIPGDGIEYLRTASKNFDWVYLDPARRDDLGGKVFLLSQCNPDVTLNLELLLNKAKKVLIKTSPLLDIKSGLAELKKVNEVHVVAVKNEVKELLWLLDPSVNEDTIIKTVNITGKSRQEFEAVMKNEVTEAGKSLPQNFLYEPNAAIMKSGLFTQLAEATGTSKLHKHSHLYTANTLLDFPGRKFKIVENLAYNKKALRKRQDLNKANITTRNFPKSVEVLRRELKINDGGEIFLFFTINMENKKIVLVCEKV